jgi:two-component system, cell cycle sensor histidine kinase and response regulator CckA
MEWREHSASGPGAAPSARAARRAAAAGMTAGLLAGATLTALASRGASQLRGPLVGGASWLPAAAAAAMAVAGVALLAARLRSTRRARVALEAEHQALQCEVAARKQLEAAHARLALAVDQATEAIALTDPAGDLEYVNPAFRRMMGWGPTELRPAAELDDAPQDGEPGLAHALASEAGWDGEAAVRRRDGAHLHLEVAVSPVRGIDGQPAGRVLLARDVTEERRRRDEQRHTQRLEAVGALAGGIAHDFNNLLSVINGYARMALGSVTPDHPAHEDLGEILAAGGRAATLTRQLLAFGRRQVMRPEVLDLNEVVAGVEKMLRRLIPEDIALCTRPGAGLRRVRLDPGQLEQVLVNLAVNARDATPAGGRIEIATSAVLLGEGDPRRDDEAPPGDYLCLSVSDDGVGMDPATLARCFEPFFTTKAPGKGTGLGLSTVYGIVRQSRGFVRVESRPCQGTRFELYFPFAEDGAAVTPGAAVAGGRAGPARPGETVLVVEDEPQLRELLRSHLAAYGYRALVAADGAQALSLLERGERADVLLSDVVMPRLSGPELARSFRARFPEAVVVFMSGYAEEAMAEQGAMPGGEAVIEKPGGLDSVAAVIRGLLDGRAAAGPHPPPGRPDAARGDGRPARH